MFETILYASFTVNVLLLCMCVVFRCRITDVENTARRFKEMIDKLSEDIHDDSNTITRLAEKLKKTTEELSTKEAQTDELQKRIAGLQAELDEHENKAPSPWAKDIPTARHFEAVTVPTEAVTLRTSVVVSPYELETMTKDRLMRELRTELLTQAAQFIEVEQRDNILGMIGSEFVGYLRVYRRRVG